MIALLAAQNTKLYWYLTRGSGAVSTMLLSASMALGIFASIGYTSRRVPRFVVQGLHRNVSLLSVVFLAIHVATTIIDGYVAIGWIDTVVPFMSGYHPLWIGMGTVALDLMLAVIITSLLRSRMSFGPWRAVHWSAYAAWPLAMWHGLQVGSDRHFGWMIAVNVLCAVAVFGSIVVRVATLGRTDRRLPAYRSPAQR